MNIYDAQSSLPLKLTHDIYNVINKEFHGISATYYTECIEWNGTTANE